MSEMSAPATGSAAERYFKLDKSFGAPDAETLWEFAEAFSKSENPEELEIASSAMVEWALKSKVGNFESIDETLFWLDFAESLQEEATQRYWEELDLYQRCDQTVAIRSEVRSAFFNIYRDLACGEITDLTREQTYAELAAIGRYTQTLFDFERDQYVLQCAAGVCYEIATHMAVISSDAAIIPSAVRGDNGWYLRESTHDFEYMVLGQDDKVLTTIPIELKSFGHLSDVERMQLINRYEPSQSLVIDARNDLKLNLNATRTLFFESPKHPKSRTVANSVRKNLNQATYNWLELFTAA